MKKLKINIENSINFKEGFEEFISNCKARNLREGTLKHYNSSYKTIIKIIDEDEPIKNISIKTFQNFIIQYRERFDINDITMYTYARDLKTLLYFFMKNGYMNTFKIKLPKTDKSAIEVYNNSELELLLKKPNIKKCNFTEYRDWVIINFLMSTGVRLNSFINIKIKDLDFENQLVNIKVTKNRKQLILPLNNTILMILKEYLRNRQHKNDDEYLFCNIYGKQLTKSAITLSLSSYNKRRGIVKTGIHRYRHTFAKKWIQAGGRVVTLQKIFGHSSLAITENYINILVEDLKRDIDKFNLLDEFNNVSIKMR